jgi:hypothetical protein
MQKAYAKPELEICRFDLEEHLAMCCCDRKKKPPRHGNGGSYQFSGQTGFGSLFDMMSSFDPKCCCPSANT